MADQNQAQAQPIDPGVQAFQNLRVEVANIGQALAAQGVSGTISRFDGNPKFYREWIRSIEKYSLLVGAQDKKKNDCLPAKYRSSLRFYSKVHGGKSSKYLGSDERTTKC